MRLSAKTIPETLAELRDLLVAYAKQETIDPLRNLGRYLGYGLGGMVLLTAGVLFIALGLLRLLQDQTGSLFTGFWKWIPYLVVGALLCGLIALAVSRIGRGGIGGPETARRSPTDRGGRR